MLDRNVFLMTTAPLPPALSILMKCWRNRNAVSPVRMGKFCWTSFAFLAAEGRIGKHDVIAVAFLDFGEVLGQRVGVHDVGASMPCRIMFMIAMT